MADNLTKEQRSYAMSQIRSRGNSSTEQALIATMRGQDSQAGEEAAFCAESPILFSRGF